MNLRKNLDTTLFEQLPNIANFKDAETLDQYLPWATKTQEKCKE